MQTSPKHPRPSTLSPLLFKTKSSTTGSSNASRYELRSHTVHFGESPQRSNYVDSRGGSTFAALRRSLQPSRCFRRLEYRNPFKQPATSTNFGTNNYIHGKSEVSSLPFDLHREGLILGGYDLELSEKHRRVQNYTQANGFSKTNKDLV